MTTQRDQEEQDIRIEKMVVEVEKLRAEIRHDSRRVVWQAIAAVGTAFAGGAAVLGLILHGLGKL
jgi:hypothetical protein